jgi:hypothetical protein
MTARDAIEQTWRPEVKALRAALTAALEQNERFAAELRKLRAEIDTWGDMWNDEALLAARVDALRDGTAQL